MKSLTGAIVARFDEELTTLQGMVDAMFAGNVPTGVVLPYVSVTEISSSKVVQSKGAPGNRINRTEVLFEVFGTRKEEVHNILRQLEKDYLNTVLTIRNRRQIGRPTKINRTSSKEGDLFVGQLSIAYPIEKTGA